jgi:hypothetical protein
MRARTTVVGACSLLALLVSTGWAQSPTPPAPAAQSAPAAAAATTPLVPPAPAAQPAPAPADAAATAPAAPAATAAPPENRLTGIETDRLMIAAEAPTDIAINGTPGSKCAFAVEFGDGTRSSHVVSEATPLPLKIPHTYPKMADVKVRVKGAAGQALPPCAGELEAAVHISPAGSKIETIALATNACPEGWSLVGQVSADKSFKCTPVPDASAPTNLIHCTDGMKYFARGGNVGCAHPVAAVEMIAQEKPPLRGKGGMGPKGGMKSGNAAKGVVTGARSAAKPASKAAESNATASKAAAKPARPRAGPPRRSRFGAEAPN